MRLDRHRRQGKVVVLVSVCLVAMMSVTALTIDGALLMANRRSVQAAAEAASLAAAIQMFNDWPNQSGSDQGTDPSGTASSSAKKTATDNGYTDGTAGVTVTVNIPPQSGNYQGVAGYAEVIITMPQQRYFSSIFGSGNMTVTARAVARGTQTVPGIGLLVLNPTASNALQLSATGSVNVNGGSVVVDSSSTSGLHLSSTGSLTAALIKTTSPTSPGYSTSSTGTVNGTVNYNQPITPDPLATFAASNTPTTTGMSNFGSVTISSIGAIGTTYSNNGNVYAAVTGANQITLYPGNYSGNFTINHNTNDGFTVTLSSGVYYFGGNITLNGYGTINSGTGGTMLYIASGSFTNSSQNVNLNLAPMTSGTYSNPAIAVWQNVNNSSQFNSSNGGNLNIQSGIMYIPNVNAITRLSAKAGTTATLGSQVITGELALTGSGNFGVNVSNNAAPGRNLYLVE